MIYPENVEWDVVRNSKDFFDKWTVNMYDVISFDHDIAEYNPDAGCETTGYVILQKMLLDMLDKNIIDIPVWCVYEGNSRPYKDMAKCEKEEKK